MKKYLSKIIKYLVIFIIFILALRIAYVNLTSRQTEQIISIDDAITYDDFEIMLKDARAVFGDDVYRIEYELSIENKTTNTKDFAYSCLATYSGSISNGIIPYDKLSPSVTVKPQETVITTCITDIYKDNVSDSMWKDISDKEFKLLLLEYHKNTGWQVNPTEYDSDDDRLASKEINNTRSGTSFEESEDDRHTLVFLDEDEFFKTQYVSVGEGVSYLWHGIDGQDKVIIDLTVEDVDISKEITNDWSYVFEDIEEYSITYTPIISKVEVIDNKIANSYSAVKAKIRINAEKDGKFCIGDLKLYTLNKELYPEVNEDRYSNYQGLFAINDDMEFIKFDMSGGYSFTNEIERFIRLKEGINEFAIVYLVPDSILKSYDQVFLEWHFIGNSDKVTHSYSNGSALIKCPIKED